MNALTRFASVARPTSPRFTPSTQRQLWPRLLAHRGFAIGMLLGVILLVLAALGPFISPYEPNWPDYAVALQAPSATHWLGTDPTGRDVLSRLLDGAHRSIGAAVMVLGTIFTIGIIIGTIAGMAGGWVDTVLMRLVDVMMTLPGLVLAFAIIGILGPGFINLLIALIVADWAYYARLARSYTLSARQRPDVIAARMAGIGEARILFRHVLPGVALQLAVVATLGLGGMISAISGFSFLGLGVQQPYAEWGAMLAESRFYFPIAPWLLLVPAGLIFVSVLAANLAGNGLRDVLEPRGRT
ncbi:ABC transporter permease [Devosia sp. 2618]|uniref:ABC transporter permease n=1 Tax=Devosia sp. 2618 TaxID=3156454 RepID=UPI003395E0E3